MFRYEVCDDKLLIISNDSGNIYRVIDHELHIIQVPSQTLEFPPFDVDDFDSTVDESFTRDYQWSCGGVNVGFYVDNESNVIIFEWMDSSSYKCICIPWSNEVRERVETMFNECCERWRKENEEISSDSSEKIE